MRCCMKNKIQIISILISVVLIAALIYVSDVNEIVATLSHTNLLLIALGLSLWPLNSVMRSERWRYILKKSGIKISFGTAYKVYLAGAFVSNMTPAKVGDPIRNVVLKKKTGKDFGLSLSSTIVERIFDVLVAISISVVGMLMLSSMMTGILQWLVIAIVIFAAGVVFVIIVVSSKILMRRVLSFVVRMFSFIGSVKKLEGGVLKFSDNLHSTFVMYKDKKMWVITFVWSFVIWLIEGVTLFIAFMSLGLPVTLLAAVVVVPISALIGVVFLLPGGLGPNEYATVAFFSVLFNLSWAQITSATIIGRLLSFWIYIAAGAIVFSTMKYEHKFID